MIMFNFHSAFVVWSVVRYFTAVASLIGLVETKKNSSEILPKFQRSRSFPLVPIHCTWPKRVALSTLDCIRWALNQPIVAQT